jgi:hypothetical protein
MNGRNEFLEMIGMALYKIGDVYFYAFGAKAAIKKAKKRKLCGDLFIINDYGDKIKVNTPTLGEKK